MRTSPPPGFIGREDGTPGNTWVVLLSVFLVAAGIGYFYKPRTVYPVRPLDSFPLVIGDWRGRSAAGMEIPFTGSGTDAVLERIYSHPSGSQVKVYIGYYASQQRGREIFDARSERLENGARSVRLRSTALKATTVRTKTFAGDQHRGDAYFWYVVDGRIVADRMAAKSAFLADMVFRRKNNGAVVVVFRDRPAGANPAEDMAGPPELLDGIVALTRDWIP